MSRKKVHRVYNDWWHDQTLFATTGTGRGKVNTNNDARRTISADLESKLRQFINAEHTAGRQIFRRSVVEWMQENSDDSRPMSCRAVSALLYRMGYRRRRGRIKKPPLDEKRLTRIRMFLAEMDRAKRAEDAGEAVVVYMDESFVHQAHASVYSYFLADKNGEVDSAFGRTTGKGQRMIIVHAITKWGPLVTRVPVSDFPIEEGWFKAKPKSKGKQGGKDFALQDEKTAEFLWQAKLAKGDYHAAMTDAMFMEWLQHRLTPAFNEVFPGKKMILVLDNASYHHGCDAEVRVPETNTKKYNVGLLRSYKARSIKVERQNENGDTLTHRFEIPQELDSSFPNANQEGGVSVAEVALATRQFFQLHHPEKLMEKVETFMRCKGWELIWTPPYMPSFQPIELFWAHGKRYVSLNFQLKRKMSEVWEQLRKGFYGDSEWKGQEGGWKPANCANLVRHAIGEMNAWIEKYGGGKLSGTIGNLVVVDFDKEEGPEGDEREDGLEEEMANDMQEEEVDNEIEP